MNIKSVDQELIDRQLVEEWAGKPAPMLGVLHAFHGRDGCISESAMKAIARGLRQPLADLYGTVTFYHHFSREESGASKPRVCTGPVCSLNGGKECLSAL